MKLCTAAQIREFDRLTIEGGTPGVDLMERAGQHCCDAALEMLGDVAGRTITIVCGGGNNGGDGFVAARLLSAMQARVRVLLLSSCDGLQGDGLENFKRLDAAIVTEILSDDAAENVDLQSDLLMDCLFGTGLSRDISGRFAIILQRMDRSGIPVLAVDIPSGIDSYTGQVLGVSVHADRTVTFQVQKVGMAQFPAREYVGEVVVVDIGISAKLIGEYRLPSLLTHNEMANVLPARIPTGHKGSFGHILLVAGSLGKTGAAILSGLGCLRSGAGLVSLCIPEHLNQIIEMNLIEAMTIPVKGLNGHCFHNGDFGSVMKAAPGKGCVVVGPGLGQEEATAQLVNQLVRELPNRLVLDADGLNLLTPESLQNLAGREVVLTPHPGEMARLTGLTVAEIQKDRLQVTTDFAKKFGVVVVLKGAATVIADKDGNAAINSTGNAGMGTGGMGDVLSGVIAALMGRGISAFDAACLGVYSHGRAGDLLVESGMEFGYLASELADSLPEVWQELIVG